MVKSLWGQPARTVFAGHGTRIKFRLKRSPRTPARNAWKILPKTRAENTRIFSPEKTIETAFQRLFSAPFKPKIYRYFLLFWGFERSSGLPVRLPAGQAGQTACSPGCAVRHPRLTLSPEKPLLRCIQGDSEARKRRIRLLTQISISNASLRSARHKKHRTLSRYVRVSHYFHQHLPLRLLLILDIDNLIQLGSGPRWAARNRRGTLPPQSPPCMISRCHSMR